MSRGERAWVETVKSDIETKMSHRRIVVETGRQLPYSVHITHFRNEAGKPADAEPQMDTHGYQTDLLISERLRSSDWVPRVVVEFKLSKISTHDALTYSAKAATHKALHPYLRYGIVVGKHAGPIPKRLLWHGHGFDFMLTLPSYKLTNADRKRLVRLLRDEIKASRTIYRLFSDGPDITLLHRKLAVS